MKIINKYLDSAWIPIITYILLEIIDTFFLHKIFLDAITKGPAPIFLKYLSLFSSFLKNLAFIGLFVAILFQLFKKQWLSALISLLLLGCYFLLLGFLIAADLSSAGF